MVFIFIFCKKIINSARRRQKERPESALLPDVSTEKDSNLLFSILRGYI